MIELIYALEKVEKKLSKLTVEKERLTAEIIRSLNHTHKGQRSYPVGSYTVEVRTPVIYSLDKKRYESGEVGLPPRYNPIKQSISYTVDKKLCDEIFSSAPAEVVGMVAQLISEKPGKPSVTIKARS